MKMLALGRRLRLHTVGADAASLIKQAGQRRNVRLRPGIAPNGAPIANSSRTGPRARITVPATLLVVAGLGYVAYENYKPFRHTVLAVVRCSRVAEAAVMGAIDYKLTFAKSYSSAEASQEATSKCHIRSAHRVLKALLANGGIFIKLGQHMASLIVLPKEWRETMRPLQDQCEPTPFEDIAELVLSDIGKSLDEVFIEFNLEPVGVASLAQVHMARMRDSGQEVAVKLQHPHLAEFCNIDMEMVEVSLGWIKTLFPEFELTWLGSEMRENLPKEMNFQHEARNSQRAENGFKKICTSLYIPQVVDARQRILIMEFIRGGRVDDLEYLAAHGIDRNKVSVELARIFAQMVHLNGWFHADPHPGNLLIRPAGFSSKSPYNFEIVLLDHGLYFDLEDDLRINYSKFWLSLIAPTSAQTNADRRKYAKLVGNIGDDLYPVFEAAITGRAILDDNPDNNDIDPDVGFKRGKSVIDLNKQTEEEIEAIRNAVVQREGLLLDVFDVLRRVPRRVLMVLKLNDLTRSLDHALATTHSSIRIFLVTAKYCTRAVWEDDRKRLANKFYSGGLLTFFVDFARSWWSFESSYRRIILLETWMDLQGEMVKFKAWLRGLILVGGFSGAHKAAAGLA